MKSLILFSIAALTALAGNNASAQNLIVNPNFSANASSFGGVGYANSGGNPFITGYAQVGGNGYGVNGPDTNPGGTPLEYFAPTGYTPVAGTDYGFEQGSSGPVSQSGITLTPGQTYMLSFAAGTRSTDPTTTGTFALTDSATNAVLVSDTVSPATGAGSNATGFINYSMVFTDTVSTSATLTITNASTSAGSSLAFTDLDVSSVPEPGTWMGGLFLLGGIGCVYRRQIKARLWA